MTIRQKIKEIGENVDKFRLTRGDGNSYNLEYRGLEVSMWYGLFYKNSQISYKDKEIMFKNLEENKFICKLFYKKAKKELKRKSQERIKKSIKTLNSINFNEK